MGNRTRHTRIQFQIDSADIDCDVNDVYINDSTLLIPRSKSIVQSKKETGKAKYSSEISEPSTDHVQTFICAKMYNERAYIISNE